MKTNISLEEIQVVYFLGIGGIGMSAIARYFHFHGKHVLGYDRTSTALTTELQIEGIDVHFDDSALEIPQIVRLTPKEKVLVVRTPAVPHDSHELNWFRDQGYTLLKRSEILGIITEKTRTIAIAGTHGKTTTSSLVAHLLTASGVGCNAFLGGISANYGTNFLLHATSPWTVVEADEFDRSFLTLSPEVSVITSMDPDHLDIYGHGNAVAEAYQLFAEKLQPHGSLIHQYDLNLDLNRISARVKYSYQIGYSADFTAYNVHIKRGSYWFDLSTPFGNLQNLCLGIAGRHNVENAVAACAAALIAGVALDALPAALTSFRGVARRFEYKLITERHIVIDDYAHHPTEITAAVKSARELYPDKKLLVVFQPHLFTRTRDFADGFASSLALADEVWLLPIYPAREQPIEGIDSQYLLDKISGVPKKLLSKSELLAELRISRPELLLMLGAGDIDTLVTPAIEILKA